MKNKFTPILDSDAGTNDPQVDSKYDENTVRVGTRELI